MVKEKTDTTANMDQCRRCGGLMIPESTGDPLTSGLRCVICGERIDPVILAHRRQRAAREEAEKVFADGASQVN
jgi:tRNA(Ile2) C34 agmatinyltransferase TiaS